MFWCVVLGSTSRGLEISCTVLPCAQSGDEYGCVVFVIAVVGGVAPFLVGFFLEQRYAADACEEETHHEWRDDSCPLPSGKRRR